MDLGELQVLVKVVQTGSFTKAAAELGHHKAHLSRSLSALERRLGVRLLERTTRKLRLTEIGAQIYGRAQNVLTAIEDIEQTAAGQRGEPSGTLKIAVGADFGMAVLSRWTDAYAEKYPQASVEIDVGARNVDLIQDGFDLAIRLGTVDESTLPSRRLGELTCGLYASPAYLEKHGTPADGDNIRQHQLLMFSGGLQSAGWRLVTLARELRIEGPARIRANDSQILREAAMRGLGIALLPNLLAKEEVSRGALKRVLSAWSAPKLPVHAILRSADSLTPKVRAFVDLATELALP